MFISNEILKKNCFLTYIFILPELNKKNALKLDYFFTLIKWSNIIHDSSKEKIFLFLLNAFQILKISSLVQRIWFLQRKMRNCPTVRLWVCNTKILELPYRNVRCGQCIATNAACWTVEKVKVEFQIPLPGQAAMGHRQTNCKRVKEWDREEARKWFFIFSCIEGDTLTRKGLVTCLKLRKCWKSRDSNHYKFYFKNHALMIIWKKIKINYNH